MTLEQIKLLPLLKLFRKDFGLVGGTAIALHIGHRRSIDFDLFSFKEFSNLRLKRLILKQAAIDNVLVNKRGEFTIIMTGVKATFFFYPFPIDYSEKFENFITLPDLLTLSAMKAYALGQRAKWKDYVDLYFILKEHYSLTDLISKAREIFGNDFNEKIFRIQLSYFDDVSYSEDVIYLPGFEQSDEIIKKELIKFSIS